MTHTAVESSPKPPGRATLGPGQPLTADVRQRMSPLLDHPLGGVRLHAGDAGAELARAHGARAVTFGRDIAFARGEFQPGTFDGEALLAHELAHVAQQTDRTPNTVDPASLAVASEHSPVEIDATRSAVAAMSALHVGPRRPGAARPHQHAQGLMLHRCSSKPTFKTNGGEFKASTYTPYDGDKDKDTAKQVGATINASFTPNDTVVSKKIVIVQMMRALRAGAPYLFPNERRRGTTAADGQEGWAVDRAAGKKSGHYGENDNGTAGSNTSFGSRDASGATVDATWSDGIKLSRSPGETYDTTVTSFALDAEHGTYLGALGWGFECTAAGKVSLKPMGVAEMGSPTGIHKAAIKKWNDQAADPDVAKRNAPTQDTLPAP